MERIDHSPLLLLPQIIVNKESGKFLLYVVIVRVEKKKSPVVMEKSTTEPNYKLQKVINLLIPRWNTGRWL